MASTDNGQELYFDLSLTSASVRFIVGLLENHRKYREDGITMLREKWGEDARTGFVEGERAKTQRAIDEITSQCLLD